MKTHVVLSVAFAALFLSHAPAKEWTAEPKKPGIIAVQFHADTCRGCQVIGKFLPELETELADAPVLFVQFDFSDAAATRQTEMLAESLGLSDVLKANKGTGYIVLVDAEGKPVETLKSSLSEKEMAAAIRAQLAKI